MRMIFIKKNLKMNNYAFIDGQNLYLETLKLGRSIDYKKLKKYLFDKYKVEKVFYFIGYKKENKFVYNYLKKYGYQIIFKEVIGKKGNCDSDLIVKCFQEIENFNQAIIISSDGDFLPLYKHLKSLNKLCKIGIPSIKSKSRLLNCLERYFLMLESIYKKIEYKVK